MIKLQYFQNLVVFKFQSHPLESSATYLVGFHVAPNGRQWQDCLLFSMSLVFDSSLLVLTLPNLLSHRHVAAAAIFLLRFIFFLFLSSV